MTTIICVPALSFCSASAYSIRKRRIRARRSGVSFRTWASALSYEYPSTCWRNSEIVFLVPVTFSFWEKSSLIVASDKCAPIFFEGFLHDNLIRAVRAIAFFIRDIFGIRAIRQLWKFSELFRFYLAIISHSLCMIRHTGSSTPISTFCWYSLNRLTSRCLR